MGRLSSPARLPHEAVDGRRRKHRLWVNLIEVTPTVAPIPKLPVSFGVVAILHRLGF
eukprot:m.46768 g.46768  ORF g.46768 m.46768 type:complete len:57 (+) comp8796_c0_seq2:310-480(+)